MPSAGRLGAWLRLSTTSTLARSGGATGLTQRSVSVTLAVEPFERARVSETLLGARGAAGLTGGATGGTTPLATVTVATATAVWPALSVTTLQTSYSPLAEPPVSHWAPITGPAAQAPTAPTRRALEAIPEPASAAVPETPTVPLTTALADIPDTAIVATGGSTSTTTVRPGL